VLLFNVLNILNKLSINYIKKKLVCDGAERVPARRRQGKKDPPQSGSGAKERNRKPAHTLNLHYLR